MIRCCRNIMLWLFAGLMVTWGIAWSLAAFLPQRAWRGRTVLSGGMEYPLSFDQYFAIGAVRRSWMRVNPGTFVWEAPVIDAINGTESDEPTDGRLMWPVWGDAEKLKKNLEKYDWDHHEWNGCEHAVGWPVVALWYELHKRSVGTQISGGIPIQRAIVLSASIAHCRALPCRPIWTGLLIDSMFWGTVAFGAWQALGGGRTALRRRRNRCPRCGYSLAGQTSPGCPECGLKRTGSDAAGASAAIARRSRG